MSHYIMQDICYARYVDNVLISFIWAFFRILRRRIMKKKVQFFSCLWLHVSLAYERVHWWWKMWNLTLGGDYFYTFLNQICKLLNNRLTHSRCNLWLPVSSNYFFEWTNLRAFLVNNIFFFVFFQKAVHLMIVCQFQFTSKFVKEKHSHKSFKNIKKKGAE